MAQHEKYQDKIDELVDRVIDASTGAEVEFLSKKIDVLKSIQD